MEPDRYRIILIAKDDAHYHNREDYIGQEGRFKVFKQLPGNWASGDFFSFTPSDAMVSPACFYKVLLKKLGQRKILID